MICVDEYDLGWPGVFERLRDEYAAALSEAGVAVIAIEHVGSTAVPGLAAKPVLDIDIVVREDDVPAATRVLVGLGFEPRGEQGIPQRWAFRAPDRLPDTHTYVVVDGSLGLRNHLAVRDVLRSDTELRDEYARVKRAAAASASDMDAYVVAKNEIVQRILATAGLTDDERTTIEEQQVPGLQRRLRDDLTAALRARDKDTARVLRTVLAAIANAEAQPDDDETPVSLRSESAIAGAASGVGAADVARRELDEDAVRAIVGGSGTSGWGRPGTCPVMRSRCWTATSADRGPGARTRRAATTTPEP